MNKDDLDKVTKSPVLWVGENPPLGNYVQKVLSLYEDHPGLLDGATFISIQHDGWCAIYRDPPGICNCAPDVVQKTMTDFIEKTKART